MELCCIFISSLARGTKNQPSSVKIDVGKDALLFLKAVQVGQLLHKLYFFILTAYAVDIQVIIHKTML